MTDEELVEQFSQSKDPKYFGELYNRYSHLAFGVGLKYLKSESAANDLVSDVFEVLYKKVPTSNIQSFKKYLYTVTRNECIAKLRQARSKSEKLADFKKFEKSSENFMENEGLIRLIDNEPSLENIVGEAINQLNEEQKVCIQLFFFQNKSYKDIVTTTGYTDKQVKSFLQNGKRNLKNLLEEKIKKRN